MFHKFFLVVVVFFTFAVGVHAKTCTAASIPAGLGCDERTIRFIGGQEIAVRVYTKGLIANITKTFVVVHANEEKGLDAAKQIIAANGGRLVEIVSNAPESENRRYLYFGENKSMCVDPNRIYTSQGRLKALKESECEGTADDATTLSQLAAFGDEFIKLLTKPVGGPVQRLIIGVHNNSIRPPSKDLLLKSWSGAGSEADSAVGIFSGNTHIEGQVFPSDTDEFVMATNGFLVGQLLDNKVHSVALQEGRDYLLQKRSTVDDGSMSIYFGMTLIPGSNPQKPFSYIVIEAGGYEDMGDDDKRKKWQMETIKVVATKIKAF